MLADFNYLVNLKKQCFYAFGGISKILAKVSLS